jgi:hypothetical protein
MGALLAAVVAAVVNDGVVEAQGEPASSSKRLGQCEPGRGNGGRVLGFETGVTRVHIAGVLPRGPPSHTRRMASPTISPLQATGSRGTLQHTTHTGSVALHPEQTRARATHTTPTHSPPSTVNRWPGVTTRPTGVLTRSCRRLGCGSSIVQPVSASASVSRFTTTRSSCTRAYITWSSTHTLSAMRRSTPSISGAASAAAPAPPRPRARTAGA